MCKECSTVVSNADLHWLIPALERVGTTKVEYEVYTRWNERDRKLAWGYIATQRTLERAKEFRRELIERHATKTVSGYEVEIRRITRAKIEEVLPEPPEIKQTKFVSGLPTLMYGRPGSFRTKPWSKSKLEMGV